MAPVALPGLRPPGRRWGGFGVAVFVSRCAGQSTCFFHLAGTPATMVSGATSVMTVAPAATTAPVPITSS